ncbi:vWA domain-containing protein [Dawidia soli]|nr:vWA domain-containing protein [Dawidia soli]
MILLVLLSLWSKPAFAQCDNSITTTPAMPPAGEICNSYSLTLTVSGPGVQNTDSFDWIIRVAEYPMGTLANIGLTGTPLGTSYKITGEPTVAGTFTLQVEARCTSGSCFDCGAGSNCTGCRDHISEEFSLQIANGSVREPVDVVLVLDMSGSMSQTVPGSSSLSKWAVLKESVQAFLEAYRAWGECGDRIGVTYFDDARHDFKTPRGMYVFNHDTAPMPLTGTGSVQADMDAKGPAGLTCLGGGILEGYSFLDPMHPKRNMIVFTDGMQNTDPMVSEAPGTNMVINDSGMRPDGTGFPATLPLDLKAPAVKFRTYTVGIGDNALNGLLDNIAHAPTDNAFDGESFPINTTTNLPASLDMSFSQTFVENLAQFSPQLLDIRRIQLVQEASTIFVANPTADKLMLRIVADPAILAKARIQIEKDGKDFSSLVRANGTMYRTFIMDTIRIRRYQATLPGKWTVRITGPAGLYQVTGIVNDESIDVSASLGQKSYVPGDAVSLEALLQYKGQPLNGAHARVWVARPGQDVNDLFAQAGAVEPRDFPIEKGNDPGQTKYEALLAFDKVFTAALQPTIDSVSLTGAGGKYTGSYSNTQASGIYTFIFRLQGNDPQAGEYERFVLRTAVIDFGEADRSKTLVRTVRVDAQTVLQITPKNKFGSLLGPNRLSQLHILLEGKAIALTDKLDGSYEAVVPEEVISEDDPKVTITIKGQSYYDGPYSDLENGGHKLPKWLWYLLGLLFLILLIWLIRRKRR